jgi:hypothetical protein
VQVALLVVDGLVVVQDRGQDALVDRGGAGVVVAPEELVAELLDGQQVVRDGRRGAPLVVLLCQLGRDTFPDGHELMPQ